MSFKDILSKLDQLSEATKEKEGGRVHTADPGGYGRKFDTDEEGDEKKSEKAKPEVKRGRGRPKKGADDSGEVKKYDFSAFGVKHGKDVKLPKHDKDKTIKHSLKEYIEKIDEMMTQQPIPVVGKEGDSQSTGAGFLHIDDNSPAGQAMKDAIGKMAQQKKAQIVMPTSTQTSTAKPAQPAAKPMATSGGATNQPAMSEEDNKWIQKAIKHPGSFTAKAKAAGKSVAAFAKEKEHAPGKLGKQARLAMTLKKMHEEMNEADLPPQDGLMGAGLGAGRKQGAFEAKKPDANKNGIPDYAEDGKGPNDLKKKKKVDESMDNRLKAAHHRGKAHALAKESYNSKYDDMEEARMYHEGYKEGLDECYGQVPIRGQVVGEMDNTVDDMASFGAHTPTMEDDVEEGNAFTAALAKTPKGGKFSVGGKTFTDRTGYDAKVDEMNGVFESWDNQLNSLLDEYQEIQEGLSVSVSKGQQGMPDSVTVSAQDGDADKLLQLVKHAGLGLFGDQMQADVGAPTGGEQHGGLSVVGDHDGMMALMKKMSGDAPGTLEPADGEDYKDEEGSDEHDDGGLEAIKKLAMGRDSHEHAHEEKCNECGGAMEEGHSCGGKEMVDEVQSEDQQEYEVAEDNAPDSGAEEFQAMDQEIAQDNAAASSHGGAENSNLEEEDDDLEESQDELDEGEDELEESYANSDDDKFQTDIDFMTKVISGGLNKEKSTGQTTIPVIAGQSDRMGYSVKESITDWKKLAGI